MTYDDAMSFLSRLANYEQKPPTFQDLALEPIRALLQELGNPHAALRVVHITGSKGKGSVAAMLELVLRRAGYRTGLYTSPQLSSFEERIRVDGVPMSQTQVTRGLTIIEAAYNMLNASRPPTFFDVVTALAFWQMAQAQVDVAIIEVGMGGRTDSTNVVNPRVSIITSISLDHVQQLGPTTTHIAEQKAGIVKPGRPVVSGVTDLAACEVIARAAQEQLAPLQQLGRDFTVESTRGFALKLLGEHQARNAAVVIAALEVLADKFPVRREHVAYGLAHVDWPARIEIVRRNPLVILDCSHNTASAQALIDTLQTLPQPTGPKVLVFACSRDKDLPGILAILYTHFDHVLLTRYTSSARAASLEDLQMALGHEAPTFAHSTDAWHEAQHLAGVTGQIIITGSIFLAGELREVVSLPRRW
jgi:dihydrofolate synthase / folylpolyglutamate synthase